jgi:hypothetical protein
MCYWENIVENIEEKKNAFTKKMDKVGELTDRKRVMVFADDDNAIDTKTHFEYITHKIDLSAQGFIDAVEEAISIKLAEGDKVEEKKPTTKNTVKPAPAPAAVEEDDLSDIAPDDDILDTEDDIFDEEPVKEEPKLITLTDARLKKIRDAHRVADADTKKEVKKYLVSYGGKLVAEMLETDVVSIEKLLKI